MNLVSRLGGTVGAFIYAVLFDTLHRSWPSSVHPVAWFGRAAETAKKRLFDPTSSPAGQLTRGAALVLITVAGALAIVLLIRFLVPSTLRVVFDTITLAATFTLTGLVRAADQVREALARDDLPAARASLRSLCSRDATTLGAADVTAAAVESVAENTSDSWVAPLFWYTVGGVPGAVVYRAVNTLDAMYGYRGRFEYFGKTAARLDDLLNLAPARLTALLFWLVSPRRAWLNADVRRVWVRDRNKTTSPNAGQPMAMMAAVLRVRLTKIGHYALGDPLEPLSPSKISDACRIARRAGWAAVALVVMIRGAG